MAKLTNAQRERLDLLQEEAAEIVQAASKILRFGYEGKHPGRLNGPTNKKHLEAEIGGLCAILTLMRDAGEISEEECSKAEQFKLDTIGGFTKYQEE